MSRLYLARHGETDWNANGKLQGQTDIPLNDVGMEQARALAERMRGLGLGSVTTSDLARSRVTGTLVANLLGLPSPIVDEELRERTFGVFEGLTREECAARHPEAWQAWVDQTSPPEGAEPVDAAVARMQRALVRAAERASGRPGLVVSHGGLMRLWLRDAAGLSVPPIANGSTYLVDYDGTSFRVEALGG